MARLKQNLKKIMNKNNNGEPDIYLIIIVATIVLFGIIMLTSASGTLAYSKFKDGYYFIKHQLAALVLGIGLFFFFAKTDYHKWKKYSFYMLVFSIFLLVLVFIPGISTTINGSRSWINLFGYSLQPSEFVKLSFLIYLAAWLESRNKKLDDVSQGIVPFILLMGIIGVLMLLQPDFGTLLIITATSLVAYFVGGGKISHILTIILIGIIGLIIMVNVKPYQAQRFKCYVNPAYSSDKECYQLNQSLIAVGSGGFWGRGFGASRQKLLFLPEVSGDSIFPIIGEEMGFIFSSGLILLFLALFYRGCVIAKYSSDNFGRVLAVGITSWLVMQAIINIGGMIDFMPMTGVPLPLVSNGGSAIMAALAAIGLLVNISQQSRGR